MLPLYKLRRITMTSGTTENSRVSSNTGAMKMYAAVHSRPLPTRRPER